MQCPLDAFGVTRDDSQVGFSRLVWLRAALFPIAQSAKRDLVARSKLLLSQREGAAKGFDARHETQLSWECVGERQVFMVAGSGGFEIRGSHRSQRRCVQRFFCAIRFDADKPAVTAHFRDSSVLAHFLSPAGLR